MTPQKKDNDNDSIPSNKLAVSTPPGKQSGRIPFRVIRMSPGDDAAPSELPVRLLLRDLRSSTSLEQAVDAMMALRRPLANKGEHHIKMATANMIAKANGTAAILMALKDWESQEFMNLALRALIQITYFVSKSRKIIVESGGVRTILAAARLHPRDYPVNASAIGLLTNLSLYESTLLELVSEECVDFVIEMMQTWPDDVYAQQCGCVYFSNVCGLEDAQILLHKKRVGVLLANVLENFYFYDTEGETFQSAKDALAMYLGGSRGKVQR
jgi:hypothetical protein